MKAYQVIVTEQAQEQLLATKQYYVFRLHAKDAAKEFANRMEKVFADLTAYPKRGRLLEESPWRERSIRVRPVKNHNVYYWIDEADATVWITAVIAGRMDQEKQLKKMKLK